MNEAVVCRTLIVNLARFKDSCERVWKKFYKGLIIMALWIKLVHTVWHFRGHYGVANVIQFHIRIFFWLIKTPFLVRRLEGI